MSEPDLLQRISDIAIDIDRIFQQRNDLVKALIACRRHIALHLPGIDDEREVLAMAEAALAKATS